ncbi:hypothetical protein B0H13DRAFT_2329471 [Mycena leptocephala]|nr:hypothetical protein B0H13DRAFT_2329471 [Mycena leptocephala]
MAPVWASIKLEQEGDGSVWAECIRQLSDRLNNLLVVASLLLAPQPSSSRLRATARDDKLPVRGPYICILSSFGLLVGAIIVTAVALLICTKARPSWTERVMYGSRFHICCTLIMLSYPFFGIGLGAILLAFGMLSAVWCAEDSGLQGAVSLLLLLPVSLAALFGVACATALSE